MCGPGHCSGPIGDWPSQRMPTHFVSAPSWQRLRYQVHPHLFSARNGTSRAYQWAQSCDSRHGPVTPHPSVSSPGNWVENSSSREGAGALTDKATVTPYLAQQCSQNLLPWTSQVNNSRAAPAPQPGVEKRWFSFPTGLFCN